MNWFVHRDNENWGPFDSDALRNGAATKELRPDDLIWKPGMLDWIRAGELSGLFEVAVSAPPKVSNQQKATTRQRTTEARSSFVVAHWRGDLSLGVTYWVTGVIFTVMFLMARKATEDYVSSKELGAQGTGALIVILYAVSAGFVLWQVVGIWRSASKHAGRGGKTFWSAAAKFMVVLGVLRFGADFATAGFPILREGTKLMVGVDDIPAPKIRILRGASELELAGGIPFGTAEKVQDFLNSAPGIKVIHLNSLGGRITEAYKLYQIIKRHELVTFTSSQCVSACTIAFLAGKERYLARGARLGFHSSSIAGVSSDEVAGINDEVRRTLEAHGAPRGFVERALNTKSSSMWYPTGEELLEAKIIHAVIDGSDFAISGIENWRDERKLEEGLLSFPVFRALKEHDQASYLEFYKNFRDSVQQGRSPGELSAQVKVIISQKVLPRYLPIAPDLPLLRYWRSQIAEMRELAAGSYQACADFVFPDLATTPVALNSAVSREALEEDLAALAQLIHETDLMRVPQEPNLQIEADLAYARKRVGEKIPNFGEAVSDPAKYKGQPQLLCNSVVMFYSEILSWRETQRSAALLRYLLSH
jgi:hypothetical protein